MMRDTINLPPDEELLSRAARGSVPRGYGGRPRWTHVMDRFGLGSTYARELCVRLKLDPDERVRR